MNGSNSLDLPDLPDTRKLVRLFGAVHVSGPTSRSADSGAAEKNLAHLGVARQQNKRRAFLLQVA